MYVHLQMMRSLCKELDHKFLCPTLSPHVTVSHPRLCVCLGLRGCGECCACWPLRLGFSVASLCMEIWLCVLYLSVSL